MTITVPQVSNSHNDAMSQRYRWCSENITFGLNAKLTIINIMHTHLNQSTIATQQMSVSYSLKAFGENEVPAVKMNMHNNITRR
jgi:hypothetical protein